MQSLKPWHLSFLIHFLIAASLVAIYYMRIPSQDIYEVPVEVFEPPPMEAQNLTQVTEKPKVVLKSVNEPSPEAKPAREIFGASRSSHTDESLGDEVIAAKKGNTLAKDVDKTVMLDSDAESLPTPTEEYLVSEMPSVLSEVRPEYPKEARDKELKGSVALDVLIDEKGMVRQVSFIEGPEIFKTSALKAMKNFRFRPAKVDGKPVAVRIRYILNFNLEF